MTRRKKVFVGISVILLLVLAVGAAWIIRWYRTPGPEQFAQVKMGMGKLEVYWILGKPNRFPNLHFRIGGIKHEDAWYDSSNDQVFCVGFDSQGKVVNIRREDRPHWAK